MKSIIIYLSLLFCACDGRKGNIVNEEIVVTIDKCQYIKTPIYGGYNLIHKANCNNPVHVYPYSIFENIPIKYRTNDTIPHRDTFFTRPYYFIPQPIK